MTVCQTVNLVWASGMVQVFATKPVLQGSEQPPALDLSCTDTVLWHLLFRVFTVLLLQHFFVLLCYTVWHRARL